MNLETSNLDIGIIHPAKSTAGYFVEWLNDPEIVKYSEQRHKTHTIESQLDYWHSQATVEPNFVSGIFMYHSGIVIGSVAVRVDPHNNIADVGIMIGDKSKWGKGYGFEAWECVCNYLFEERKIRKIEAGMMGINKAMIRICEKYGMRHEAIVQDHFLLDGQPVSMHLYGKLAR